MRKRVLENYPQGGVHLKHAAISPHIQRTVSGAPPISIHTSRTPSIDRIRIYGNTVDDIGVGDPTSNLAKPSGALPFVANGVKFSFEDDIYNICGTKTGSVTRAFAGTTCEANTAYIFIVLPEEGYTVPPIYLWNSVTQKDLSPSSRDAMRTFISENYSFNLAIAYNSWSETSDNIDYKFRVFMLKGTYTAETIPEYEPYGYKIPFTLQNGESVISKVIYMDTPLYRTTDYAEITADLPKLAKGTTVFNAETAVSPSMLEVNYSS